MLTVLTSGLPLSAKNILEEALTLAFGKDVVAIEDVKSDLLRTQVRVSSRNMSYILVVLDGVSTDTCKDIENGLYKSDRFCSYADDTGFVLFLNKKFGISMSVPEEEHIEIQTTDYIDLDLQEERVGIVSEDVRKLKANILDRESIISNLNQQIQELNNRIKEFDFFGSTTQESEEIKRLRSENKMLKSQNHSDREVQSLRTMVDSLQKTNKILEKKHRTLSVDYQKTSDELTDLKVLYSQQSGVLTSKKKLISELESKLKDVEEVTTLKRRVSRLEESLASKEQELKTCEYDLQSCRDEISALREKGITEDSLRADIKRLQTDISSYEREVSELKAKNAELLSQSNSSTDEKESLESKLSELTNTINSLQERIKDDDKSLTILNKEKLELQSKVRTLEMSTSEDEDLNSIMSELTDVKTKYLTLSNSPFGRIASFDSPKCSPVVQVLRNSRLMFNNIRFAFSGNAESRKGTYKCLLDEFKKISGANFLIVDLVSETSIDYVFEIQRMRPGLEWFRVGGDMSQFLSDTCLQNTKVLSPGLGYINDVYFLSIPWERRLIELENSGYKVVVYCGDISNVVGRVLHESFASYGASLIYVQGNAVGSRSIITNIKGISNSKDSIIMYYDFNPQMKRFIEMVAKTNKYQIINN